MAACVGARARADVRSRYGVDILSDVFELHSWRDLQGDYITRLLRELRVELKRRGLEDRRIGVGVARGDVLGPPLGNTALHWRDWIGGGLIDHLIVNQNSSQCPSMWHQLWPMHRGGGYVQNYLDGHGLPALADHVRATYARAVDGSRTQLFVARQWSQRCADEERELCAIPGVAGLVFSSFRHDNPAAIARGDWRAGASRRQSSMSGSRTLSR
jgi:hypothetical protein